MLAPVGRAELVKVFVVQSRKVGDQQGMPVVELRNGVSGRVHGVDLQPSQPRRPVRVLVVHELALSNMNQSPGDGREWGGQWVRLFIVDGPPPVRVPAHRPGFGHSRPPELVIRQPFHTLMDHPVRVIKLVCKKRCSGSAP